MLNGIVLKCAIAGECREVQVVRQSAVIYIKSVLGVFWMRQESMYLKENIKRHVHELSELPKFASAYGSLAFVINEFVHRRCGISCSAFLGTFSNRWTLKVRQSSCRVCHQSYKHIGIVRKYSRLVLFPNLVPSPLIPPEISSSLKFRILHAHIINPY